MSERSASISLFSEFATACDAGRAQPMNHRRPDTCFNTGWVRVAVKLVPTLVSCPAQRPSFPFFAKGNRAVNPTVDAAE
jgi:hypothetical protein